MIVFCGLVIALSVGFISATQNYKVLGLFVFTLLLFLNSRILLFIYFVSAQLIYLTPSLMNINGFDLRISDVFFALLIIKVLMPLIIKPKIPEKMGLILALFVLSCVLSFLKAMTISPNEVVLSQVITFIRWMTGFLIIFMIPKVLNTEKQVLSFSKIIFISILFHAVLSLFNFGQSQSVIRASNEFGNVADYAIIVVLLISLIYGKISNRIGKQTNHYLLLVFLILSLFITFTRAAMIAFVIVTVMYFLKSKRFSSKVIVLFGILTGIPLLVMNYWGMFQERFINDFLYSMQVGYTGGSFGERSQLLLIGIKEIGQDPLLGKGWSSFRFLPNVLYSEPHNNYLQIVMDNGLVGLVIFLILLQKIYSILKENHNKAVSSHIKAISFGLLLWFTSMFIWLFSNQLLPGTLTNVYFWVVVGLGFAINNNLNKKESH
jgi:O-antigen ligase